MSPHPGLLSSPSTPTLQKPTSCRRGAPQCSPGRPLVRGGGQNRPPPPHQLSVLQMRGQACGWPGAPSPSSREGRTTPLHARQCRAGERAESGARGLYPRSPHPEPLLYPDPPSLLQPLTCSCSQLRRCGRRLRPHRLRSALAPLSPAPSADFSAAAPLASLPAPSFLPST